MQKIFVLMMFILLSLSACTLTNDRTKTVATIDSGPKDIPTTMSEISPPYTAKFEIYTNGTKRIFTAEMYHDQSKDVYIESTDPSIVHVTKDNITWDYFFKTLPFSLSKECLITGTKQTFCNSDSGQLRFILNGEEVPNSLDLIIKEKDTLEVRYGKSR